MDQISFHEAAEICDIEGMQNLLDQGVPVDCRDCNQNTPLHFVEKKEAAEFLINNRCDIDARNSEDQTALMVALEKHLTDVAIILIDIGADVNCCDVNNWNALHIASFNHVPSDIVRLLASKVSDINAVITGFFCREHTALSLAAFLGYKYIVDLLIHSGANVSIGGTDSWTVFHSAVYEGWMDIVVATVNEFNVNSIVGDGYTPILLATEGKHYGIVELLLKYGANIHLQDNRNRSPLYCAVPDVELIILLINNGAYLEHFDYAAIHKNTRCRERILGNTELCIQIAMNEYNNLRLPTVYQMYGSVIKLPLMDSLKIKNNQTVISEIETSVNCEMQRKTFCNVMDLRPLVLQMMVVRSLIANRF